MLQRFSVIVLTIGLILALSSCEFPGSNVVTIDGEYITTPTTWTSDNLYYVKNWVAVQAALIIEPGTIVAFGTGATMTIGATGQLTAIGTSSAPIVFTSAKEDFTDFTIPNVTGDPALGDWDYLYIQGNSSTLKYCNIRYCTDGLWVEANSVTVQNDTFTYNGVGLDARDAGTGFTVGTNTFYGNTHPFYAGRNFNIDNTNIFQNGDGSVKNTWQSIEVEAGDIVSNITWNCTTVAYTVPGAGWLNIVNTYVLTLAPDVVLKFNTDGYLKKSIGGSLTSYENAKFTSIKDDALLGDSNGDGGLTTPAPGDWDGILDELSGHYLNPTYLYYYKYNS